MRHCLNTVNDEAEVNAVVACSRCGLRLPEKHESRKDQVIRSRGPESVTRRHVSNTDQLSQYNVVHRRTEHGTSGQQPNRLCAQAHVN